MKRPVFKVCGAFCAVSLSRVVRVSKRSSEVPCCFSNSCHVGYSFGYRKSSGYQPRRSWSRSSYRRSWWPSS